MSNILASPRSTNARIVEYAGFKLNSISVRSAAWGRVLDPVSMIVTLTKNDLILALVGTCSQASKIIGVRLICKSMTQLDSFKSKPFFTRSSSLDNLVSLARANGLMRLIKDRNCMKIQYKRLRKLRNLQLSSA